MYEATVGQPLRFKVNLPSGRTSRLAYLQDNQTMNEKALVPQIERKAAVKRYRLG